MSDYFVPVLFPQQSIGTSVGNAPYGHAGWVQIKSDGSYSYYEYGRYEAVDGSSHGNYENPFSGGPGSVTFGPSGPNIEGILSSLHGSRPGVGDIAASVFEVPNGTYDTLQGIYGWIVEYGMGASTLYFLNEAQKSTGFLLYQTTI